MKSRINGWICTHIGQVGWSDNQTYIALQFLHTLGQSNIEKSIDGETSTPSPMFKSVNTIKSLVYTEFFSFFNKTSLQDFLEIFSFS